ncbi:MAG: hypothetical protein ABMB14_32010 [Myxococcota bacterium]
MRWLAALSIGCYGDPLGTLDLVGSDTGTRPGTGGTGAETDTGTETSTDTGGSDTGTETGTETGTGTTGTGTDPIEADLEVCADGSALFTEIQDAIDVSAPGDVIAVCPGTYGPIEVLWSFDVTIVSTGGPASTVIDGGADTAVFVRDGTLSLSGFRLDGTGVDEPWSTDHGAALTVEEGDVTVSDCVVDRVTGPFALVFDENLLVLDGVSWTDNDTDLLWFLWQGDDAVITHNTVTGGVHHGVIAAERLDQLHLSNNVFDRITIDTAQTAFELETTGTGPMVLENNVFHDIDDLDPWGGRLFTGTLTFRNNIVAGSAAGDLVPIDASYSLFWDNQLDYGPFVTGIGNQYVDPEWVDPAAGDFHLGPASPAIDAGDPNQRFDDADGTRSDVGRYGGE